MTEKEYIERNDLIKNLNTFAPEHYSELINNLIIKQPVADVLEVIRCKDCIHHRNCEIENIGMFGDTSYCALGVGTRGE